MLRSLFRFLCIALALAALTLALLTLGFDLWRWIDGAGFRATSLGQLWTDLHATSFEAVQALVQSEGPEGGWAPTLIWLLLLPASAVLGALGFLALLLTPGPSRPRRRRGLS